MNGRNGTMSPVSADDSEWSGIGQYQLGLKQDPPFSPTMSSRGALATPPVSAGPSPSSMGLNVAQPAPRRPGDSGNPSPPSSIAARSSVGTLSDQQSGRYRRMEESLAQHYNALRRYLGNPYASERAAMKTNKARDKLLRLSPTQFHELSTDVFDELIRRQQAAGGPGRPPRPDIPPFLPPREDFHEKRNQARQKLASLQPARFRDLATDVFCELERRFPQFAGPDMPRIGSPAGSMRGGPPNGYRPGSNGFPPNGFPGGPRPGSRGPGGRGYPPGGPPGGRFPPRQQSLGGGVSPNGDEPLPKSFQSNTIVPNKSTLVEDDDLDDDYDGRSDAFGLDSLQSRRGTTTTIGEKKLLADSQAQVSNLQERIDEMESLMKSKDEEISRLQEEHEKSQASSSEREEWESLKAELENKVNDVENANTYLQTKIDQLQDEHSAKERDLLEQLETAHSVGGDIELQQQYDSLETRHQTLQVQLQEQQKTTEEVRRDAATFLKEMRAMSERSNATWEREEKLSRDVNRLEEEVKEWKSRYIKAKTQLRHLRTSSVGISNFRPDVGNFAKENELMQPNGMVKDTHVTKFQISIDELLRTARSGEPGLVLEQMKVVVVTVRHIINDMEASQNGEELPFAQKRAKSKVSVTANNLITASKNFASSSGLSPISLLDAAASHLSTAIIELLRLVKICASPAEELEDEDEDNIAPMQSPGYFSVAPSQGRLSNNGSVYSAISSPSTRPRSMGHSRNTMSRSGIPGIQALATAGKAGYGMRPQDHELEELKLYLEDQTQGLVQTIQALVTSIRGGEAISSIRGHIANISVVVGNVVSSTDHAMNKAEISPTVRQRVGPVVQTLADCSDRLSQTGAEGEGVDSPDQLRDITSKLPPIAFEIARETKELVQRIDQLELDEEDNDEFR
ncbi:putative cell polarity protein [Talaromyces proteolyticus]|uniref:Cell polarity protein n=1 Tax=Talaromyces proteolyticus TaxID=1131652 RepID=A0AAD4KR64_9EURO|nr:putative cell polarity protein [Talaromyces proteolyticus]KAH8693782.1 putative cell polarity protein [Talaromyces proteolyticus]